jgi:hypothetical protein
MFPKLIKVQREFKVGDLPGVGTQSIADRSGDWRIEIPEDNLVFYYIRQINEKEQRVLLLIRTEY